MVFEKQLNKQNVNKSKSSNNSLLRKFGGSATNDICTDYNDLITNVREILTNLAAMLSYKNHVVNKKNCIMVSEIFDKLQISESKFKEVIEKLNKDKRLSRASSNGRNVASINGGRNQTVKKRGF